MIAFKYSLYAPESFSNKKELFDHIAYELEKELTLVPNKFNETIINPRNFYCIKEKYKFSSITILDRHKGNKKEICVLDHINKSGYNFLYKKTPFKDYPTFPDMSQIYNPIRNLDSSIVHTVGPERFQNTEKEYITSEIIGLVAPVWHYVKVKVFGNSYPKAFETL